MTSDNKLIDTLAKVLWNYCKLNLEIRKADIILGLGSHDLLVAERASDLYLKGYANKIIFSGGLGKITSKLWHIAEADKFAEIALNKGVPQSSILIENRSETTAENIKFTLQVLKKNNLKPKSTIIVSKPYKDKFVNNVVTNKGVSNATFTHCFCIPLISTTETNLYKDEYAL